MLWLSVLTTKIYNKVTNSIIHYIFSTFVDFLSGFFIQRWKKQILQDEFVWSDMRKHFENLAGLLLIDILLL